MPLEPSSGPPKDLPRIIGGYRVLRELGRGRLGPLLSAIRRSWAEDVALRIVRPEWSCLPVYVSRLIRDAHAAAQVEHPNLVPITDLGESQGRIFIASEYVHGETLEAGVNAQGALTPRDAVATVLQTARGLRAAHAHGLSHGDVSPATIFIDSEGRTRLADLGLTKNPAAVSAREVREKTGPIELAAANAGALNLEGVRADLKGLGKTLAFLMTGKAGETDATSLIARGVPVNLVEFVRSLIDSKPGSGFDDLGQAVAAFEKFLNARRVGGTTPREEDTRILQESLISFRGSPKAQVRIQVVAASASVCALIVVLGVIAGLPLIAGSFLGLGLMTAIAYFVVNGMTGRDALFPDVRGLVLESRGADLAIVAAGVLLLLVALIVLHLQWAWFCFGILAVVLAVALHRFGDLPIDAERKGAVEEARALVKEMRLRGVAEDAIRSFVRAASGENWGPFFQDVFGEKARISAQEPADRHLLPLWRRPGFAIRSLVWSWVQARLEARRHHRNARFFQQIEEKALVAEGVNLLTARRKARRIGAAMVAVTSEHRDSTRAAVRGAETPTHDRPTVAFAVKQAVEAPEAIFVEKETGLVGPDRSWLIALATGARTRFLIGTAILAGFLLWVHQNGIVSGDQLKDVAEKTIRSDDPMKAIQGARIDVRMPVMTKPLEAPFLPGFVAARFNGLYAGIAGLILLVSSFVRGSRVGYFAIPGAIVALILPTSLGSLIGAGLASMGLLFGTTAQD